MPTSRHGLKSATHSSEKATPLAQFHRNALDFNRSTMPAISIFRSQLPAQLVFSQQDVRVLACLATGMLRGEPAVIPAKRRAKNSMRWMGTALTLTALIAVAVPAAGEMGKTRVFVGESDSWEVSGGLGATSDGAVGGASGGARPQTVEIMKTFSKRCPEVTVTLNKEKADYVVLLEHEGGKDPIRKDNKFAVFNADGDMIAAGSTRSLGNVVKDACMAVQKSLRASSRDGA